jgi:hypothetical protein
VEAALSARLSPERTRRATLFEQLTVQRLNWDHIVRLHRYAELFGKLATAIWVGFIASIVLGFEWILAARSMLGFARWRLQRELWRRDVERLEARAP